VSDSSTNVHSIRGPEVVKKTPATPTFDSLSPTGFMREPQVLEIVPVSHSTLWRKCKAGEFPKPVKLSKMVTAWRVGDVREWLAAQALK
jgi:prophage regulatory protein